MCLDGSRIIEVVVQKLHVQSFGHKIVEYFIFGFECSMHEHGEQIDLQIVHPIEHNNSDPNGIEGPKIIVSGAGHGDQTELAEGQEEQVVRYPDAHISDE